MEGLSLATKLTISVFCALFRDGNPAIALAKQPTSSGFVLARE